MDMDTINDFIGSITGILWGIWTPVILLLAGIIFTIWTRFTQYRAMTHGVQVVRGVYDDPNDPGAINHFQALSAALSATVGLGNIGGVALAIAAGGPGALFWMWVTGVFGMALKTVEITLAMMYRNVEDPDNPSGGAMWVVEKVIGKKGGGWAPFARAVGIFFCVTLIISTFTGGNMFQSWSVATITEGYFELPRLVTGILLAGIVGAVILGGIKRIGSVAGRLVPFMVVMYLVAAFTVIFSNIGEVFSMLSLVVESAFSPTEATGAFLGGVSGWAFIIGMQRALFSNEAGQGSAPIAHAAAKTDEAAREGVVGGIGPFIDTLCICTVTALVILLTGTWNRDAIKGEDGNVVPYAASITFEEKERSDEKIVFSVSSPGGVDALPNSRWDDWSKGDNFFLMAEVTGGAKHGWQDGNRVRVQGEIKEMEGVEGSDAPPALVISWSDVELDFTQKPLSGERGWSGEVTGVQLLGSGVYHEYDGALLTGHAFDRQFGGVGVGKWLVTFAAWLFAISTMISWCYYGEQGMVYMVGRAGVLPYKLVFLALVIFAATGIKDADQMVPFMDLGTGAMLWSNIPIMLALGFLAVRELKRYDKDLKDGKFPRHDAPSIVDRAEGKDD